MGRTKKYTLQVYNRVDYINKKARQVEKTFGLGSEQYERYVNATTAALPPGTYKLSESGRLTISKSKENLAQLKTGQLSPLTKLPTAQHSMEQAKQAQAQNRLRVSGNLKPTTEEITAEARNISDEEALNELSAKAFIQDHENSKGKLKYNESVRADMQRAGNKTYQELKEIIEKGEKIAKERRAQYQREYRARNREEVNRKQREYRARNREEVNRKQREYRARRRASED